MASVCARTPRVKSRSNQLGGQPDPAPRAGFTFLMVPDAVAADPDLSPGAKLLFGAILSLSRSKLGRCVASNECLARMTGLSVVQVRRLLAILEGRGLIARVMDNHERVEIRVEWSQGGRIKMMHPASPGADQIDAGSSPAMMQGDASIRCTEITTEKTSERETSSIAPLPETEPGPADRLHSRATAALVVPPGRPEVEALGRKFGPEWIDLALVAAELARKAAPVKGKKPPQGLSYVHGTLRNWLAAGRTLDGVRGELEARLPRPVAPPPRVVPAPPEPPTDAELVEMLLERSRLERATAVKHPKPFDVARLKALRELLAEGA